MQLFYKIIFSFYVIYIKSYLIFIVWNVYIQYVGKRDKKYLIVALIA